MTVLKWNDFSPVRNWHWHPIQHVSNTGNIVISRVDGTNADVVSVFRITNKCIAKDRCQWVGNGLCDAMSTAKQYIQPIYIITWGLRPVFFVIQPQPKNRMCNAHGEQTLEQEDEDEKPLIIIIKNKWLKVAANKPIRCIRCTFWCFPYESTQKWLYVCLIEVSDAIRVCVCVCVLLLASIHSIRYSSNHDLQCYKRDLINHTRIMFTRCARGVYVCERWHDPTM